jgi:hypothetical protein
MSDKPCFGHAGFPFDECLACRANDAETASRTLTERLAEAEAAFGRMLKQCEEANLHRDELHARLASAQEAARWLLYDAPGKPYTEVEAFVRERPWLKEGRL